jgi:hypothetical protein
VASDPASSGQPPDVLSRALTDVVVPLGLVLILGIGFLLGVVGVLRRTRPDRS